MKMRGARRSQSGEEIIIDTFPQTKKCEKRIKRKIKQEKSKN